MSFRYLPESRSADRPHGKMHPAVKRRLATLAVAALLLLLWIQSAICGRTLWISAPAHRYLIVTSASGRLMVYWSTGVVRTRARPAEHGVRTTFADRRAIAHRGRSQWWIWFGAEAGTVLYGTLDSADMWTWGFNIPWWYLVAPTVVLTGMHWRRHLPTHP
jgi:hypothetical protein